MRALGANWEEVKGVVVRAADSAAARATEVAREEAETAEATGVGERAEVTAEDMEELEALAETGETRAVEVRAS